MIAICVTAGFILALTRAPAGEARQERSLFRAGHGAAGGVNRSWTKGIIVLAAGGTGGHLFPAEALGHELKARGYRCIW